MTSPALPSCALDLAARWRQRASEAARKAIQSRPDVAGYGDGFHAGESAAYEVAAAELPAFVEQLSRELLARPARPAADDGEE